MAQATLDMDATLVETHKRAALYCYKHFKAYQPLNSWWAEQGLIVHSAMFYRRSCRQRGATANGWHYLLQCLGSSHE